MRVAGVDLHDLVPHLVGHQAETQVRALGSPALAAAALVARERGLRRIADELRPHVEAEASARVVLWDAAGRRDLHPDAYREARQRLHGRDIQDFRAAASGPVVIMGGVEMSLQEAVAGALEPRRVQIAVPSGYKKPKRIAGFAFGGDPAAGVRDRLLEGPAQAPGASQEPPKPAAPPSPQPDPRIRHRKP